ncbi:MAG: SPASM domain-containing protein [Bacteroidota bacterium]
MFINGTDILQLASKLTLKRLINAFSLYWSYQISRSTNKPQISGLPFSISIEPTTACNLGCSECPSGLKSFTRPTGKLNEILFRKIIDELSPTLGYLILYFQGEPYLHPQLNRLISYAHSKNIYTATSTNAHFLTDEIAEKTVKSGLDRLIISIDGTTQEVYESYRKNGDLSKVLDGTKKIIEWKKELKKKSPQVVWQFLVVKPNEHQIEDVKQLAKSYGVDKVAFKTAQIYDYVNGNPLIPIDEKYSRYKKNGNGYKLKYELSDECWKMWHSCVITWDGQVVPCCFDKDADHPMGNLHEQSFEKIWYSKPYQNFRESLFNSRSQIEMCKNCSEGSKVWT